MNLAAHAGVMKKFWLSEFEVLEYEKDGLPIFTRSEIESAQYKSLNDTDFLKVYYLRSTKKATIIEHLEEINLVEKDNYLASYQRPATRLSLTAQDALKNIYKALGKK